MLPKECDALIKLSWMNRRQEGEAGGCRRKIWKGKMLLKGEHLSVKVWGVEPKDSKGSNSAENPVRREQQGCSRTARQR